MKTKKRHNCWLVGFVQSAAILALVWVPNLLANGLPASNVVPFIATGIAVLSVGTLVMGCIDRWREPHNENDNVN